MSRLLRVALPIVFLLSAQAPAAAAPSATTCPETHVEATFNLPPAGVGYQLVFTVNSDCSVSASPLGTVDANATYTDFRSQLSGSQTTRFDRVGQAGPAGADPDYHMDGRIWDCCGTIMTQLVTDLAWSADGAVITSWSAGGYESHHGEFTCGGNGGWSTVSAGTYYDSGGNGQNFIKVHGHGEWSYRGAFDACARLDVLQHLR